jgi:hypothetical protein
MGCGIGHQPQGGLLNPLPLPPQMNCNQPKGRGVQVHGQNSIRGLPQGRGRRVRAPRRRRHPDPRRAVRARAARGAAGRAADRQHAGAVGGDGDTGARALASGAVWFFGFSSPQTTKHPGPQPTNPPKQPTNQPPRQSLALIRGLRLVRLLVLQRQLFFGKPAVRWARVRPATAPATAAATGASPMSTAAAAAAAA